MNTKESSGLKSCPSSQCFTYLLFGERDWKSEILAFIIVKFRVLSLRHQLEIFGPVVSAEMVFVVSDLGSKKQSPQDTFQDETMLPNRPSTGGLRMVWCVLQNIAERGNTGMTTPTRWNGVRRRRTSGSRARE